MAEDLIRYDILAQDALRGVVRKVLTEVARTSLPGEHHFYITFATHAPGVRISSRLLNEYPEEMTIVLQHQYWDLNVTDNAFEVGLSFNGAPERLLVPFAAIKVFQDPSVPFGLQFAVAEKSEALPAAAPDSADADAGQLVEAEPAVPSEPPAEPAAQDVSEGELASDDGTAQVVSLDAFRKKQ
jgi:hypothetical protein